MIHSWGQPIRVTLINILAYSIKLIQNLYRRISAIYIEKYVYWPLRWPLHATIISNLLNNNVFMMSVSQNGITNSLSIFLSILFFGAKLYKNLKTQVVGWNNQLKKSQNRFSLSWYTIKVIKTYWHWLTFLLYENWGNEYSYFTIFRDFIQFNKIYA